MPERNEVPWTAMIAGYAKNGIFDKAVKLFHAILSQACVNNKALPRRKTSSFPHNSHRIWIRWHIFSEQGFASMSQVQSFGRCSHCLWSNAKVKQCLMDCHDRSLLQAWAAWESTITVWSNVESGHPTNFLHLRQHSPSRSKFVGF